MSLSLLIRTMLVPVFAFLLAVPGPSTEARAGNTATGIALHQETGRTRCTVTLDRRPVFTLKELGGSEILLLLMETGESDSLREDATRHSSVIRLDSGKAEEDLAILFTLPGPLSGFSAAWISREQALHLDFVHEGKGSETGAKLSGDPVIRDVRFGFGDMRTRMAISLGGYASWELTQPADDRARLRFPSVRSELEERVFGPAHNLALAGFERKGNAADIDVKLLTRIDRVHLFWTEDGRHLVADFFEGRPLDRHEEFGVQTGAHMPHATPPGEEDAVVRPGPGALPGDGTHSDGPFLRGRITRDEDLPFPPSAPDAQSPMAREYRALSEHDLLIDADPAEALLYGLIRGAFEESDHKAAAELCKEFLSKFPASPIVEQVAFLNGDAEFGLVERGDKGRFSSMMAAYQSAISRFSRSPIVPRAHLNMGRAAALVGNHYAAIGYLNLALNSTNDPDVLADSLVERGRINLEINRPENAVMDFKAVTDDYPESPQALRARMGLAMYYQAIGLHYETLTTLERLADDRPQLYLTHPQFLLLRGTNALRLEQYDKARDFFFHALNVGGQPEGADLLLARIGDTYYHASMPREAEVFYRTVIQDYPQSEGAAIAKLRLAGYEIGYGAFEELLEEHPDRVVADLAKIEMAKKMYEEGQYTKAMETLAGHISDPFQTEIRKEARNVYYRAAEAEMKRLHDSGDMKELVEFYGSRRAELRRKIDPEVIFLAGISLNRLGRHSEAVTALENIEAYDLSLISRGERLLALAESLFRSGKEVRALALLERKDGTEVLTPTDRQRLDHMLAGFYLEVGRKSDAYRVFKDLVERERLLPDGKVAAAYLEMGRIYSQSGDSEEARTSLNRCIEILGNSDRDMDILSNAYSELGTSYYLDGRYTDALNAFNKALEKGLSPEVKGYYEMLFNMARAYIEKGEIARAEPILVELSEEGDNLQQQRAMIWLGRLGLDRQLQRISLGSNGKI